MPLPPWRSCGRCRPRSVGRLGLGVAGVRVRIRGGACVGGGLGGVVTGGIAGVARPPSGSSVGARGTGIGGLGRRGVARRGLRLVGADQAEDQRHDVGLLRPGAGLLAQLLGDGGQLGPVLALEEGHVEAAHAAPAFVVVTCSVISCLFQRCIVRGIRGTPGRAVDELPTRTEAPATEAVGIPRRPGTMCTGTHPA